MRLVLGIFIVVFFVFESISLVTSIKNAREQKRLKQEKDKNTLSNVSQEHVGNSKDKK